MHSTSIMYSTLTCFSLVCRFIFNIQSDDWCVWSRMGSAGDITVCKFHASRSGHEEKEMFNCWQMVSHYSRSITLIIYTE